MKILRPGHLKSVHYVVLIVISLLLGQCKQPASLNALVVSDLDVEINDGVKAILENTGLFDADIAKGNSPNFSKYDVVVLNLNKAEWNDQTRNEFITYVQNGGGAVVLGGTSNAFDDWPDLAEVIGTPAGSGLRKSTTSGEFQVENVDKNHPVTGGLQSKWIHTKDYLLFSTESLDGEVEVLATSWADTTLGGNGDQLPVMLSVMYGEGRVFHSTLGYAASGNNLLPIQCVGYITTLQRGAEWAATGVVSQEAPMDFPNSVGTHEWVDYKPLTLEEILKRSASYEIGKSKKYLTDFSRRIRHSDGKPETYTLFEAKILEFLNSDATPDSKKYMCKELSWMGSEKSIPVLEKLLNDKDLSEAASYALQRLRM